MPNETDKLQKLGGSYDPFVRLGEDAYSREQCFSAYQKADSGFELTIEDARLAAAWLVHPLNTTVALAPYGIASLLLKRQKYAR